MVFAVLALIVISAWVSPIHKKDTNIAHKNTCTIEVYSYKINQRETIHVKYGESCNPELLQPVRSSSTDVYTNREREYQITQ